jgi:tetratricopeptide (TPR) repeat protein
MRSLTLFILTAIATFFLFAINVGIAKKINIDTLNGFGPMEESQSLKNKSVLQKQSAKEYIKQGQEAANKGNYKQAIDFFTKALEINPNDVDTYIARAWAYYKLKDYKNASYDFTKAIELNRFDNDAEAYYGRGCSYYNLKSYDQALFDLNRAIELKPNYAEAYNTRGWLYYNKKDYDKAIADFTKAIRYDSKNADAYYGRGSAYRKKGDNEHAQKDLKKACELSINYCKS